MMAAMSKDRDNEGFPWISTATELEVFVPVGGYLVQGSDVAVAVPGICVFGEGCQIRVKVVVDRNGRSDDAWAERIESVRPGATTGSLAFDVLLGDGSVASTMDAVPMATAQPIKQPVLVYQEGGGAAYNGRQRWLANLVLWLWPLPPDGELRLGMRWDLEGLSRTELVIDAGELRAAARQVSRLLP